MATPSEEKGYRLRYVDATVDQGDHGMGAVRTSGRRVGLLELTERLRWVPSEGEGWDVPIRLVDVLSPKAPLGMMPDGLALLIPGVGHVRIRVTLGTPALPFAAPDAGMADARASGRLRKTLLRRGAADTSGPTRTEVGGST